jgi:hypothetical protein
MTPRPFTLLATLALLSAGALTGSWSRAAYAAEATDTANVEEARQHFAQGLKLYKEGDHDAALVQFERAYSIKPNYKVLYNIAQCYFELHQYVEARDTLARYLKDGEGNVDPERKTAVEKDLGELERRIAHLKLLVDVDGATVYVDGKRVGVTPIPSLLDVNEGQRTVSIEAPDRGSKQRVVRVAGGEEQVVEVHFETTKASPPPASARAETLPQPRSRGLSAGFWVSGIGALVLGAGAATTGYLTLKTQGERDDDLKRPGVTRAELDDARRKTKTLALSTDILSGGALVCAGIATVLFVTHDAQDGRLGLGVGPQRLELHGRF